MRMDNLDTVFLLDATDNMLTLRECTFSSNELEASLIYTLH